MKGNHRTNMDEVAAKIVELSKGVFSAKINDGYIALKVGNRIAASVHETRASFFIPSTELLQKAREHFKRVELAPQTKPRNKEWYRIWGLSLNDLQNNETLFEQIVHESLKTVDLRKKN
jgi:hypothetical protein